MNGHDPNTRMISIACPWPYVEAEATYVNQHSSPTSIMAPYRITFDRYQSLIIIPEHIREAVEQDIDQIFKEAAELGKEMWKEVFTTALVRINIAYEQHKNKQLVDDAREQARVREFNRNLIREFETYRDLINGKWD